MLLHEEIYLKQREKIFWLAEGDANTKIFHATASARKKTNRLSYLVNDHGEQIEDHDGLCRIVQEYFNGGFMNN